MAGNLRLERLIRAVESIGGPEMRAQLSQKLGSTSLQLIRDQLNRSVDCYGQSMPTRKGDGAAPLRGLANAFTVSYSESGIRVGTSKWYAIVHQHGWVIRPRAQPYLRFRLPGGQWVSTKEVTIPRRQLVPAESTGGLGPVWGPALRKTALEFMRDHLMRR